MKITEVKLTRRFVTDEPYEFVEVTVTSEVDDDETATDVIATLKTQAEAGYKGEETATETKPTKGKKGKQKPEEEKEEEEEEVEEEDEEEEEESEEEEEDPPAGKSGKAASKTARDSGSDKGKKTFKKKPQVYQRANETHKEIFSNVLKLVAPNWKKTFESKALAKKVSVKMEGKEFLDENGKTLQSFKDAVKKAMAGKK